MRTSTRRFGLAAFARRMVSAKCPAPPSARSSRSTLVRTTYSTPISASVRATFAGSSGSGGAVGLPALTAQKRHPRVQSSPMSMRVIVPPPQHSPMLGHWASSQTV